MFRFAWPLALLASFAAHSLHAQESGATDKLPHIHVDVKSQSVRVECESCNVHQDVGLEFFCVSTGTNEYESVLRSDAKPSQIHLAMLMIGLQPGQPVHYSQADKKWIPPHGPALSISCEWTDAKGKLQHVSAQELMRSNKTKKPPPPFDWVFTGSKIMDDGKYAADTTGYIVSVLNNELTMIDVPQLASRDLESRELDRNDELLPPAGTKIFMLIEPVQKKAAGPTTTEVGNTIIGVQADGKVTLDGMSIAVDRLGDALQNRRLPPVVQVKIDPKAPEDVVKQVAEQLQSAHVQIVSGLEGHVAEGLPDAVIEFLTQERKRLLIEADRLQQEIDVLQSAATSQPSAR
jgi:hypothetical protein